MNTATWRSESTPRAPLAAATGDAAAIERVADTVEEGGLTAQVADGPDQALYLGAVAHALVRRGHTVQITVVPQGGGVVEHRVRLT